MIFSFLLSEVDLPPAERVVLQALHAKVLEALGVGLGTFTGRGEIFFLVGTVIKQLSFMSAGNV